MDIVRDGEPEATNYFYSIEPERPPYQVVEGGSRICSVRDPEGKLTTVTEQCVGSGSAA